MVHSKSQMQVFCGKQQLAASPASHAQCCLWPWQGYTGKLTGLSPSTWGGTIPAGCSGEQPTRRKNCKYLGILAKVLCYHSHPSLAPLLGWWWFEGVWHALKYVKGDSGRGSRYHEGVSFLPEPEGGNECLQGWQIRALQSYTRSSIVDIQPIFCQCNTTSLKRLISLNVNIILIFQPISFKYMVRVCHRQGLATWQVWTFKSKTLCSYWRAEKGHKALYKTEPCRFPEP